MKSTSASRNKKTYKRPFLSNWLLAGTIFILLFSIVSFKVYRTSIEPDSHCFVNHTPVSKEPKSPNTAKDYFLTGDYQYERGACDKAVEYYSAAIKLDPKYAEAYNNRGYTYMRMRKYDLALSDLDNAIKHRPDYINALMNRGDIYNYYYSVDYDKALANYNKILDLGVPRQGSLCGHRLMALNRGWSLNIIYQVLTKGINAGCI